MKKYLYLLLLSAAFLGCSKEVTPRIKLGEITLTRADMNNSTWQMDARVPSYIFNASGDIIDRWSENSLTQTAATYFYTFEDNNIISHYVRYKFPDVKYTQTIMLTDGTVIPAGSSAPWIKTEYFFKKNTDESLYFTFDSNSRDVQTNISPIGTLKDGERLFLYELTPQRFTIRQPRKDLDSELPNSQYVMWQYQFDLTTDGALLEQLLNAPIEETNSLAKADWEYTEARRAWEDSFRKK